MLCLGFSVKIASPNSAALRIVDPSVSLESVVFLSPGVAVPQQILRLPADSGPQDRPRLKGSRFRLEQTRNTFPGRWPSATRLEAIWFRRTHTFGNPCNVRETRAPICDTKARHFTTVHPADFCKGLVRRRIPHAGKVALGGLRISSRQATAVGPFRFAIH
jgi:hypothetical protein